MKNAITPAIDAGRGLTLMRPDGYVAVLLLAVILITLLVTVAIVHALPPESDAEKALKPRYRERRMERVNRQRG
jgi:hypothetical protein